MIVSTELEIKPCPFCGSDANLKTEKTHAPKKVGEPEAHSNFWVKCSNLDCSVSSKSSFEKDKAVERWNVRA